MAAVSVKRSIGRGAWVICFNKSEALRAQILVVTRHQYGISALIPQPPFRRERCRRDNQRLV